MTPRPHDIAIIGMAAHFARAPDVQTFWENILGKVDAIAEASDRWSAPFFDPASSDNARIYTRKGGFLGDTVEFDPSAFGVMPATVAGGDADHFLALATTMAALGDAGYAERSFDRDATGIIFGHGTYVNRGYNTLLQHGQVVDQTLAQLEALQPELDASTIASLRAALKDSLPPFSATTVPSLVPNIITGRIANRLDLRGPNYIVDAACASSLVALELAVRELIAGRCRMMLTGGIHSSTPPQIYMMFCQLNALSHGDVRPFDQRADGTLLGEGLGVLVLKRREDAEYDGDRIYALIQATGTASDGRALGLLTPRKEGQVLALSRAYRDAGIDPASVGLVEAHGTGTPVGDETEVESLREIFGGSETGATRALGSVKSMIGHCISAAGAAGVIKTALALHEAVLPPMLCDAVNPNLRLADASFYVNTETRPWVADPSRGPRRAAINAFGFGGINAHVVLEEYRGPDECRHGTVRRRWPTELIVASAADPDALAARLRQVLAVVAADPGVTLPVVARWLSTAAPGPVRLGLIASDVQQLQAELSAIVDALQRAPAAPLRRRDTYYSVRPSDGGVGLLFPGEGSQYQNMLADLCVALPSVRRWFDLLDEVFRDSRDGPPSGVIFPPPTCLREEERAALADRLFTFDVGSAAVFASTMALHDLLVACGVRADAMAGHSTGEGAALIAAGIVRYRNRGDLVESTRRFYETCRALDRSGQIPKGRMISVGAVDQATLARVLDAARGSAVIALDNCPNQKVLFCDADTAPNVLADLQQAGAITTTMTLDRAYHTEHFAPIAGTLRALYDGLPVGASRTPVFSCVTTEPFPGDPDQIRALATRQWFSRVRFRETVEAMHAGGVRTFIEIGPGAMLSSFVRDTLGAREHGVLTCAPQGRHGLTQIQRVLGQLFARGVDVDLTPLFACRDVAIQELGAHLPRVEKRASSGGRIDLTMPRMTATARIAALARERATNTATPAARHPVADASPASGAPVPAWNPKLEVLRGHFKLMNDFLAAQSRVMGGGFESAAATDAVAAIEPDAWPLLGTAIARSGDGLRAVRRFDLDRDPWLRDHTLSGASSVPRPPDAALPVVPFTAMMELVAEAACCLAGTGWEVVELNKVRGHRWLALDEEHATVVVEAKIVSDSSAERRTIEVSVRQPVEVPSSGDGRLVFEGVVVVGRSFSPAPPPVLKPLEPLLPSHYTADRLYGPMREGETRFAPMFHGPSFHVVKAIRGWNRHGLDAEMEANDKGGFFRGLRAPRFQLDPVLLDGAGHLIGYWVAEQFGADLTFFPFGVRRYRQYASPPSAGRRILCRAAIRIADDEHAAVPPRFEFVDRAGQVVARADTDAEGGPDAPRHFEYCRLAPVSAFLEASFEFFDEDGRLFAQIDGWRDRYFSIPHRHYRLYLSPSTEYLSVPAPAGQDGAVCRRINSSQLPYLDEGWQIWKRALARLVLTEAERPQWRAVARDPVAATSWLLSRVAAKEAVSDWLRQRLGVEAAAIAIQIVDGAEGEIVVRVPSLKASEPLPAVSMSELDGVHSATAF